MDVKHFEALLKDGSTVTKEQYPSVSHLPKDQVVALKVEVEFPQSPNTRTFHMKANVDLGERLHFFVRRAIRKNIRHGGESRFDVFVMEISRGSERLARFYLPPEGDPIFTTEDLYF